MHRWTARSHSCGTETPDPGRPGSAPMAALTEAVPGQPPMRCWVPGRHAVRDRRRWWHCRRPCCWWRWRSWRCATWSWPPSRRTCPRSRSCGPSGRRRAACSLYLVKYATLAGVGAVRLAAPAGCHVRRGLHRRPRRRLARSRRLLVHLWMAVWEAMRPVNVLLLGVLTVCILVMVLPVAVVTTLEDPRFATSGGGREKTGRRARGGV